jgi:DNA-binding NtrC family response regulator
LSVGIQAGLMAKEGIELERSAASRPPVLFFDHNPDLSARFCAALRVKGWHVTAFSQAEEVLGCLERLALGQHPPVVVGDLEDSVNGDSDGSLLESVHALSTGIPVVVLGENRPPEPSSAAHAEAAAFLPRPSPEQFLRFEGEGRFDAFVTLLEQTVTRVAQGT